MSNSIDTIATTTDERLACYVDLTMDDLPESYKDSGCWEPTNTTDLRVFRDLKDSGGGHYLAVLTPEGREGQLEPGWPITEAAPLDGGVPAELIGRRGWWMPKEHFTPLFESLGSVGSLEWATSEIGRLRGKGEELHVWIDQLRSDREGLREQVATLQARLHEAEEEGTRNRGALRIAQEAHRHDIAKIGERLIEQAERRSWCSEYDEIVDDINCDLTVELPTRTRDFDVTVRVEYVTTVSVSALNSDEAWEQVSEDWGLIDTSYESINDVSLIEASES